MTSFKRPGEIRFRRTQFAHDFCVGTETPFVLMAFFDSHSKSFSETWVGQGDTTSKESGRSMVKTAEAKLAVWAALQDQQRTDGKTIGQAGFIIKTVSWSNAGSFIIGIGAPVEGIFPILSIRSGSNRDSASRQLLIRMGLAFVAQQLTEELYERSSWMENLVAAATNVLSIQFVIVSAQGEVRYNSQLRQQQSDQSAGCLISNGQLSVSSKKEGLNLQDAIRDATSFERRTSIVSIFSADNIAHLVLITPVTVANSDLALVMFENDQTDHFKLREHFFNAYGLTRSESKIAHEILSGRSIAEAAESKSLSPATVRSYMKQVLAKTGTHKQSELISLYFSSTLPISADLKVSI